jgi:hypothetical protein
MQGRVPAVVPWSRRIAEEESEEESMSSIEQRARELLAAEYERNERHDDARMLRDGLTCNAWSIALRAIEAALRLSAGADSARLDALEALLDEQPNGMLLLHHGAGSGRGITGLGLRNTGRNLRAAIDAQDKSP